MLDPDNITGKYVLKKGKPVPEPDLMVWAESFERNDRRIIFDRYEDYYISTVFLGLDHSHLGGTPPLLYETMVFGGPSDQYQERYATKQEAKRGHRRARRLLRKNRKL